jgi:hypothetical protein
LDKAKIYKAGYKQGATVPRTMITQNKRFIRYFRVFCLKACAAEEMPRVKGLLERFIFIQMTEGCPKKDWADLNKEDEARFREIRNILLKWRLATREAELPDIELPARGRLKELWKPVIQIVSGLTVEKDLRTQIEHLQKERLNEKINTLEGHIIKVICSLYKTEMPLNFADIWDSLVTDLKGKIDDKKPNKMDTPEFGEVTKQKIGFRLREALGGHKTKTGHDNDIIYFFQAEKLCRIAKKYGCSLEAANDANKRTTPVGVSIEKQENKNSEDQAVSRKGANLQSSETEKETKSSSDVVRSIRLFATHSLDDLAAKTKSVYRLTMDFGIETCVCCGVKGRPDWQVTEFDDSWGFLCGPCGLKLSERLGNQS